MTEPAAGEPAPFLASVMQIEPQWIDYNGHLNMAYYNVLFDRAVDEAYELIGIGADYVSQRKHSFFTAEVHLRYLRELHAGDQVRVTFQLLDYDRKRLHTFEQLFHAEDGWVAATSENMSLHVDMVERKTASFPDEVTRRPMPSGRATAACAVTVASIRARISGGNGAVRRAAMSTWMVMFSDVAEIQPSVA